MNLVDEFDRWMRYRATGTRQIPVQIWSFWNQKPIAPKRTETNGSERERTEANGSERKPTETNGNQRKRTDWRDKLAFQGGTRGVAIALTAL